MITHHKYMEKDDVLIYEDSEKKIINVELIKNKQHSPEKCRTENRPGKHTRAMIIEIEKTFCFVEV